jgi:8-oxo-dGTP diphosphatase
VRVVAALIESAGKLLVCRRRRDSRFGALKWEFPGGKAEPGETPEQALERELREELGVETHIGPEVYRTRHRYAELPDTIELLFFAVRIRCNIVRNLVFEQIAWYEPASLANLDFLPADRELIDQLASGSLPLPTNPGSFAGGPSG